MERSSPLAAMQPQSIPFGQGHWGCGTEKASAPGQEFRSVFGLGRNSFNFKDMSMGGKKPDYFNLRPSHGNSPTASLAVDLSQNFHIDRSPAPPTPRRSLFATTGLLNTFATRETLTTPPPSSDLPSPIVECMEVSPLPHKAPFSVQTAVQSPTPDVTPSDSSMEVSDEVVLISPVEAMGPPPPPPVERRRPNPLRPSLSRAKGYSTTSVATRTAPLPTSSQTFTFNSPAVPCFPAPAASMSLDDCFIESPPRDPVCGLLGPSLGTSRSKSAFQKTNPFSQPSGSPVAGQTRKPCAPYQRPRKQFRRSLSMFEHPEDVLQQQPQDQRPEPNLHAIMDVDEAPQLKLPHTFPEEDSIPRITKDIMANVLDGNYNEHYDKTMIIDCRFEYEYTGGHIDGAVNFNDKEQLAKTLFNDNDSKRTLLIFHCEYSVHRAPLAARYIRGEDRNTNVHQYPKLTFPEVYILQGGYRSFFEDHKARCYPQNYVEMDHNDHANACEKGLGRVKRQQRGKLSRAQTFAFGQGQLDSSPTSGSCQSPSSTMTSLDDSFSNALDCSKRLGARRMASF